MASSGSTFSLSTHVLNTTTGRPGSGMNLRLQRLADSKQWEQVGSFSTNSDGRVPDMPKGLPSGVYKIIFDVETYFAPEECFYPDCTVSFKAKTGHYHVPLLISPFGFSTYRGS